MMRQFLTAFSAIVLLVYAIQFGGYVIVGRRFRVANVMLVFALAVGGVLLIVDLFE